jgi:hypothetical protein
MAFHLNLNVEDFWIKLKIFEKDGEYPFKDVSNFLLTVLSLPQSNVSCERMFSKINLIKIKERNCLNTKTLNGILSAKENTKKTIKKYYNTKKNRNNKNYAGHDKFYYV